MKKTMMITMAVITAITLLASCKKEYTCACDVTSTSTTVAEMDEYESFEATYASKGTANGVLEKTSKKVAKAACVSGENTVVENNKDIYDLDFDDNIKEKAYTTTTVTKLDCSLEK